MLTTYLSLASGDPGPTLTEFRGATCTRRGRGEEREKGWFGYLPALYNRVREAQAGPWLKYVHSLYRFLSQQESGEQFSD